ncbi:hypothetical protein Sango_2029500 [Sesamum angolense]|uniref:Uncharacterized protein n=1 Tax=Sesamum angolense TaxID=2727404 RepID=A0AAE1WFV6_9LAMI|nr:hypothetical protein Sango_2029500 [Sesamum angolense]
MHQIHQTGVTPIPVNGSQMHSSATCPWFFDLICLVKVVFCSYVIQSLVSISLFFFSSVIYVLSVVFCPAERVGEPVHNNSAYQAPQPAGAPIKTETVHQTVSAIPNVYTNGASSVQPSMRIPVNMAGHAGRIDVSGNMLLAQNSNTGMMHGMNGMMIKSEGGYAGDSQFMFGGDNNLLEPRNAMGEASVSPFDGGESSSQALNEAVLESEMNSFGFLGQIPRSFSLSDLTADFSNSTDILESYSKSPFLGTDANFLDPHIRGEQGDIKRLDTISEGLSYEDFGSD